MINSSSLVLLSCCCATDCHKVCGPGIQSRFSWVICFGLQSTCQAELRSHLKLNWGKIDSWLMRSLEEFSFLRPVGARALVFCWVSIKGSFPSTASGFLKANKGERLVTEWSYNPIAGNVIMEVTSYPTALFYLFRRKSQVLLILMKRGLYKGVNNERWGPWGPPWSLSSIIIVTRLSSLFQALGHYTISLPYSKRWA